MLTQEEKEAGTILVYTDGGCFNRGTKIGAWAFHMIFPDKGVVTGCAAVADTTNNRMEMMAVIKALELIKEGDRAVIVSDSQYVIKGATEWYHGWLRNGWYNAEGNPVKNKDLWLRILELGEKRYLRYKHVKGHRGNVGNELVDGMCSKAMAEFAEGMKAAAK